LIGQFRFQIYLALLIVFTGILALLSLQSFSAGSHIFNHQDKVAHFFAYGLTAWLACQVLGNRFNPSITVILSFLYASITGAVLELLQAYFTSTRQGEWTDLVANLCGAMTGCVIFSLRQRLKNRNECNETDRSS
jgi:VanZ family protein